MSLLNDSILSGRFYIARDGAGKDPRRSLRKAQSHGSFLSPLVNLVQDPFGSLGKAAASLTAVSENAATSTSEQDNRKQILYMRLNTAESYDEWKAAATELDVIEGNEDWKEREESTQYDYVLVKARLAQLDEARLSCDVKKMMFLIRTSLTRGLGGMGDLRLYKHSHIGTKSLIERYIDSVQKTLAALLDVSAKQADCGELHSRSLLDQLLLTRQSFGRSALLLSGGGTLGMNHIGVVKSLWEAQLLPRLISGASAGSIVCAVLCARTDEQIPALLEEFCYGDLAVFGREGEEDTVMKKVVRFLKYGALYDISHLMRVMRSLLGDITFQEAYNRTRRILNITVSSASLYELPRLLNYVTAPNVMIWSAVCASCSVPLVFSTASLLAKDPKTGKEVPWNPVQNCGWIDGSVDNDLPMTRLAEMFNVNHFIVSQVNPHVVPFLAKEDGKVAAEAQESESGVSAGSNWVHRLSNLAKGELLHRLQVLAEIGIFPNYLGKARSVLNQRYSGDITIFPDVSYAHFPRVLRNPTIEYMLQCMLTGERATWPKLSMVQNHVAIELSLDETVRQLRARVAFSPTQVDLRVNPSGRPYSQGADPSTQRVSDRPRKVTRFESDKATFGSTTRASERRSFLPLPPAIVMPHSNPYPQLESRKFSSILEPPWRNDEGESSSNGEWGPDTDLSELLSSPSPPRTPTGSVPSLWPSTHQLFPYASQPATPAMLSPDLSRRKSSSSLDADPANTAPDGRPGRSIPEARYKPLFHLRPMSTLPKFEDNSQNMSKPRSRDSPEVGSQGVHDPHSAGLGLLLDTSGTRGMMLRKKRSSRNGSTAV